MKNNFDVKIMRMNRDPSSEPEGPPARGRLLRRVGLLLSMRMVFGALSALAACAGVLAASLAMALTPAIALCWVAWLLDRHEREPLRRIGDPKAFNNPMNLPHHTRYQGHCSQESAMTVDAK